MPAKVWLAAIQTDLSAGTIDYVYTDDGGAGSCQLQVTLEALASVDSCDDCSRAASMTVSAVSVISDEGACDLISDPITTKGSVLAFGQSTASLGEYEGIEYFELLQEKDGDEVATPHFEGPSTLKAWARERLPAGATAEANEQDTAAPAPLLRAPPGRKARL